ncbi:MAG: V-type ATPase subunit [Candidatus Woesearchaeota archaeon]|nr:V-type ATPase subunit [Candidatus Woesearchaeota archaeon]MDP7323339.1 V-type ATPase subunit [Candidatus Woesearchaeota archaeon]MDP7457348.1 V-type ATPase subunit [Candidatus Woesearchaeota archaeon]
MAKLRLGFDPYTYARISVMKGSLIKQQQWQNLIKMGLNEIMRYLQDSGYKEEIGSLGVEKRDLAQLEMALNNNLMKVFSKLKRISDENVQIVLRVYLQRYDMLNFKSIIRGKMTGISKEEILQIMIPSINHSPEYYAELVEKDDIESILKAIPFELNLEKDAELFEVENALDRAYYENLKSFSDKLGGQGKAFKEFIEAELNTLNIKMILRFKKEDQDEAEIKKYLIMPEKEIEQLLNHKELKTVLHALKKMKLTTVDESDDGALNKVEIDLDTSLLRKEALLMHQYPLTVNVILGFMFAKEIEVKNLKILVKGKKLGLDEDYLQNLLAVA